MTGRRTRTSDDGRNGLTPPRKLPSALRGAAGATLLILLASATAAAAAPASERAGEPRRVVPRADGAAGIAVALADFAAAARGRDDSRVADAPAGQRPQSAAASVGTDRLDRLVSAYERLRAEHLLQRDRFATVRRKLERDGAGTALERHAAAERAYEDHLAGHLMRVDGALAAWRAARRDGERAPADRERSATIDRLAAALLETLTEAAASLAPAEATPRILRASSLPHRSLDLAPRSPVTEPRITPSYLDASDPAPAAADLAPTREAPLSRAILEQAAALGHDPVAIFEFVRNEVATEWYAGAMKGAEETLRQRTGNDVDQAALLVALLRASSQPARFVHGVVELPLSLAAQSLGVAEDAQVPLALARAGVAHSPVVRGGRLAAVAVEHTWVSARLPYGNYRGTVVDLSARTWVPLAPALEGFDATPSTALLRQMGFDSSAFVSETLGGPQASDPLAALRQRVHAWLSLHEPAAAYDEQLGRRSVAARRYGLAPSSMPAAVVAVVAEQAALDPSRVQRVELSVRADEPDDTPVTLAVSLPLWDLTNRRVTLSYLPATVDDHRTIDLFGGLDAVPPYLVRLRPALRIDGRLAAVGEGTADMADLDRLEVRVVGPADAVEVSQTLVAGSLHALALGAQRFLSRSDEGGDPGDGEGPAARLLTRLALRYGAAWDAADVELAGLVGTAVLRPVPALVFAGSETRVARVGELPVDLAWRGVTLDAALRVADPIAAEGAHQTGAARDFLRLSSLQGSALEGRVLEEVLAVESISADEGIGLARLAGMPVHRLDATTVDGLLPLLDHPSGVLAEIEAQARSGLVVEVPERRVRHRDWLGSTWRAEHTETGASGYFLAGGLAGGATVVEPEEWPVQSFVWDLMAPYAAEPNTDPLAAAHIVKVSGTDGQSGVVGELLPQQLSVLVFDEVGRPVQGAEVTFESVAGGGLLGDAQPRVTVPTDRLGMASVPLRLGTNTAVAPLYLLREESDVHPTRALLHEVSATATSRSGALATGSPFTAVGLPGPFARLRRTDSDATELVGLAGLWVDTLQIAAEDAHGNPISNVEVEFDVLPAETDPFCENHAPPNGRLNAVVALAGTLPGLTSCVAPPDAPGCPTSECNSIRSGCFAACTALTERCWAEAQSCEAACGSCEPGDAACEERYTTCRQQCQSTLTTCYGGCDGIFRNCPVAGCRESSVTAPTSPSGVAVAVRMGTELDTTYSVRVAAPEKDELPPLVFVYTQLTSVGALPNGDQVCFGPGTTDGSGLDHFVTDGLLVDSQGRNVTATHTGDVLPRTLGLTLLTFVSAPGQGVPTQHYASGVWTRVVGNVTASVTPGGGVVSLTARPDHSYEAVVRAGALPSLHEVEFAAHPLTHKVDPATGALQPLECPSCRRSGKWSSFWGVDPDVAGVSPRPIELGAGGTFASPVRVDYLSRPADYTSGSSDVELSLDDGTSTAIRRGSTQSGAGSAHFRAGERGDAAQVVLNRGTVIEVRSPVTPLSFSSRLFPAFSPHVELRREIDLPNGRACSQPEAFTFSLSRDALVDVTLRQIVDIGPGQEPELGSSQTLLHRDLEAGEHSVPLLPEELLPGLYKVLLHGTDTAGVEEVEEGTLEVGLRVGDSLPLGHVMVQGVDLFDGSLVLSREDFSVPGRGEPLALSRTYASGSGGALGPLGAGWTFSYDVGLVANACGELILRGGEGSGIRFVADGAGGYRPLRGYHGTLVADPATFGFDFYPKGGSRYHFEPARPNEWVLDSITDPNGNVTDLAYVAGATGGRQLASVTDPSGRALRFRWERRVFAAAQGDVLVAVEGPGGLAMRFEYDDWGNLARALREPHPDGRPSRVERYEYATGPEHPLEQRHLLVRAIDEVRGAATSYVYSRGEIALPGGGQLAHRDFVEALTLPEGGIWRIAPDFTALAGDASELTVRVTDPRAQVTTYTLNRYGAPLAVADPAGGETRTTWDLDHVVVTALTDANGNTTTFEYDAYGNLLREALHVSDVDGGSQTLALAQTYWPPSQFTPPYVKDRLASRTDRAGHTTHYHYDARGNLVGAEIEVVDVDGIATTVRTAHSYYPNGDLRSTTDPRGNTTTFAYDAAGNPNSVTDPRGGVTATTWDARSRPTERRDPEGRPTLFSFDTLDREIQRTLPPVPGEDEAVELTLYEDVLGEVTAIDAEERPTVSTFDREGRVVRIDNAAGGTKVLAYDGVGNKIRESSWHDATTPRFDTTFSYDAAGRLAQRDEPLGRRTAYAYDLAGNLVRETLSDAGDPLFPPRVTEHDYDEANRRIRTRRLGDGFTVTEERKLDGEGREVLLRDPLGRETEQRFDALGRLIERLEPEWHPGQRKRTLFYYDADGDLIRERRLNEPVDQQREWQYDELGRPVVRRDATGGTTHLEYDRVGNLLREIDPLLDVVEHAYDARDRRISTTERLARVSDLGNVVTTFEHDRAGNLVRERLPNGNVRRHRYDALDRLIESSDALGTMATFGYDARGNRVRETDGNGNATANTYDGLDRLVRQDLPESRVVQRSWDAAGNVVTETDPRGGVERRTYDRLDRLVEVHDPAPHTGVRRFAYDLAGNKVAETDRRGFTTDFDYDPLNRLASVVTPPLASEGGQRLVSAFEYDAVGNPVRETDRRGILTERSYDAENRLLETTRAGVRLESREYDTAGNLRFTTDANGNVSGFELDERGLVVAENRPLAAITSLRRDVMGDVVLETDPEGRETARSYDPRRRLVEERNGAGERTLFEYDGAGNRIARVRPNAEGDATRFRWEYDFDGANRLIAVRDPTGAETVHGYDGNGNRVSQRDALGRTTTFTYDELDRRTAWTYPDGAVERYGYDAEGNLVSRVDPNGASFSSTYDELGRKVLDTFPTPGGAGFDELATISYRYDGNGNPVAVDEAYTGPTGLRSTRQVYDPFDRLEIVTDGFGKTLRHGYDAAGNRTALSDPDGLVTRYRYDELNRISQVELPAGGGTAEYRYLRDGRLDALLYPGGARADHAYDLAGRVQTIVNRQGAELISSYVYRYDLNGNRLEQVETNGGAPETTLYGYDATDRLTEVAYPEATVGYTYDAVGNRLTERRVAAAAEGGGLLADKSYAYDDRDRLLEVVDGAAPAESAGYRYDANGNQIARTRGGLETRYRFDSRDQLVGIDEDVAGGGFRLLGRYLYDWRGLRVEKRWTESADDPTLHHLRFTWDGLRLVTDHSEDGATAARYAFGADGVLAMTHSTEGQSLYLLDALGTPTTLLAGDASVRERATFDAWGEVRNRVGASENRFAFTGHELDPEDDLYYAKARFFDSQGGRFLSADPFQGLADMPPSLHEYLYAFQNPTVLWDPTGLATEKAESDFSLFQWANDVWRGSRQWVRDAVTGEINRDPLQVARETLLESKEWILDQTTDATAHWTGVAAAVPGVLSASAELLDVEQTSREIATAIKSAARQVKEDPVGLSHQIFAAAPKELTRRVLTTAVLAGGARDPRVRAENTATATEFLALAAAPELAAGRTGRAAGAVDEFAAGRRAAAAEARLERQASVRGTVSATEAPGAARFRQLPAEGMAGDSVAINLRPRLPYILFNESHRTAQPRPRGIGPSGGRLESHHPIQQAWARANIENYDPRLAPTVTLERGRGLPHQIIWQRQEARRLERLNRGEPAWGTSLGQELQSVVDDFRAAGFDDSAISRVLHDQYRMLDKLGVEYSPVNGFGPR